MQNKPPTVRGPIRLGYLPWTQEIGGSNPLALTMNKSNYQTRSRQYKDPAKRIHGTGKASLIRNDNRDIQRTVDLIGKGRNKTCA